MRFINEANGRENCVKVTGVPVPCATWPLCVKDGKFCVVHEKERKRSDNISGIYAPSVSSYGRAWNEECGEQNQR